MLYSGARVRNRGTTSGLEEAEEVSSELVAVLLVKLLSVSHSKRKQVFYFDETCRM